MKQTYSVKYFCTNCGKWFYKTFSFGEVAKQGECTNCGVSEEQVKWDHLNHLKGK